MSALLPSVSMVRSGSVTSDPGVSVMSVTVPLFPLMVGVVAEEDMVVVTGAVVAGTVVVTTVVVMAVVVAAVVEEPGFFLSSPHAARTVSARQAQSAGARDFFIARFS